MESMCRGGTLHYAAIIPRPCSRVVNGFKARVSIRTGSATAPPPWIDWTGWLSDQTQAMCTCSTDMLRQRLPLGSDQEFPCVQRISYRIHRVTKVKADFMGTQCIPAPALRHGINNTKGLRCNGVTQAAHWRWHVVWQMHGWYSHIGSMQVENDGFLGQPHIECCFWWVLLGLLQQVYSILIFIINAWKCPRQWRITKCQVLVWRLMALQQLDTAHGPQILADSWLCYFQSLDFFWCLKFCKWRSDTNAAAAWTFPYGGPKEFQIPSWGSQVRGITPLVFCQGDAHLPDTNTTAASRTSPYGRQGKFLVSLFGIMIKGFRA